MDCVNHVWLYIIAGGAVRRHDQFSSSRVSRIIGQRTSIAIETHFSDRTLPGGGVDRRPVSTDRPAGLFADRERRWRPKYKYSRIHIFLKLLGLGSIRRGTRVRILILIVVSIFGPASSYRRFHGLRRIMTNRRRSGSTYISRPRVRGRKGHGYVIDRRRRGRGGRPLLQGRARRGRPRPVAGRG